MNRKDVELLCKQLAAEHPGWEYQSHIFKNKSLTHSEIWIDPSWVLHLSAEPHLVIYNHSVNKVVKESLNVGKIWTVFMPILSPDAHNNSMIYRELVHTLPDAEAYIRDFFQRGLDLVERYFYSEDEKIFLSSYPIVGEFPTPSTKFGYEDLGNCMARAILLDFEYVQKYIDNELPTPIYLPIHESVKESLKEWLPIWKQRAAETGSILKPTKKRGA